jgi:hypothetical protein
MPPTREYMEELFTSKAETNEEFFKLIDGYINGGRFFFPDCNCVRKIYAGEKKSVQPVNTNPFCPIEYTSIPEGEYELNNDEVQMLKLINDFETKSLNGIRIGDLYKTTKIVLCDAPNDTDLLGSYGHEKIESDPPRYCPVVYLYMDRIESAAKEYGYERKDVTAYVYIFLMMLRYFDIRPDLGWKKTARELEMPMAVFATMIFMKDYKAGYLQNLVRAHIENLRNSKWYDSLNYYVYLLGLEMFDQNVSPDLINTYRLMSLTMHHTGFEVISGKNRNDLAKLVILIKDVIDKYTKFFPLEYLLRP